MTVTNISYILDYSAKTNAPVMTLYWPTTNTLICNKTFTWRGHVDDFTAKVTAQFADASGNTNFIRGIVERDGNFWIENLPAPTGTNRFTLTAVDAAGPIRS